LKKETLMKRFATLLLTAAALGCGGDAAKTDAPPSVHKDAGPASQEAPKAPEGKSKPGTGGVEGEEHLKPIQ
jgi:hypothetical protein